MNRRYAGAVLNDPQTRCLLAVLAGHNSVRDIGTAAGMNSTATTYEHLQHLRRHGLVTWEPGKQRTIRPLVEVTA